MASWFMWEISNALCLLVSFAAFTAAQNATSIPVSIEGYHRLDDGCE